MLLSDAIGIIKANPGERQIRMGERIIWISEEGLHQLENLLLSI
jgi:hypothetical protein